MLAIKTSASTSGRIPTIGSAMRYISPTGYLPRSGYRSIAICYNSPMKAVTYGKKALKDLDAMPVNDSRRVRAKINQYAADPQSQANNIVKMQNETGYRLRVGDWRVRFDENDTVIEILRVLPRGQVYKKHI